MKGTNMNKKENVEKIAYRNSLVAFIDFLGFKKLIETTKPDDIEEIRKHLKAARKVSDIELPEYVFRADDCQGKMFSDSIAISIPVGSGSLHALLLLICHIQGEMANRGIFLRGAVVVGKHFEDDKVSFGPALNNAIELEKTLALWPRIVIHPDVIKLIDNPIVWLDQGEPIKEDIEDYMCCDTDGITYINYLEIFCGEVNTWDDEKLFLRNHRKHITKEVKTNKNDLRIVAKYHWLANYHNAVVKKRHHSHLRLNMAKVFPTL